ncbi:hypothetical protein [Algicola sagamiensis]|uniref:hypothetical protein n=1 Tax=Algicola sagamiensis TaxID=163869 RepID=UPI0003681D3C|nr:hypothetical protein [Algicola sagamiensis]
MTRQPKAVIVKKAPKSEQTPTSKESTLDPVSIQIAAIRMERELMNPKHNSNHMVIYEVED